MMIYIGVSCFFWECRHISHDTTKCIVDYTSWLMDMMWNRPKKSIRKPYKSSLFQKWSISTVLDRCCSPQEWWWHFRYLVRCLRASEMSFKLWIFDGKWAKNGFLVNDILCLLSWLVRCISQLPGAILEDCTLMQGKKFLLISFIQQL